jgi:hypothetical protein
MKYFPARTTWLLVDFGPIFTRTLFPGVLQVSFKGIVQLKVRWVESGVKR